MKKIVFITTVCLLLAMQSLFAEEQEESPVDFNIQIGASTSLASIGSLSDDIKKLGTATAALDQSNKNNNLATDPNTGQNVQNLVGGYNGAASAFSGSLAALRFRAAFQLGFKPVRGPVTLALGLSSGVRLGGMSNIVNAAQGAMVFFDVPVHAYIALIMDLIRFDGMLGVVFSASTQDLSKFTSNPGVTGAQARQLLADAYNAPKFDMVLRLSLSMFYLDLNGAINLGNVDLSSFRVGLGVNINVFK